MVSIISSALTMPFALKTRISSIISCEIVPIQPTLSYKQYFDTLYSISYIIAKCYANAIKYFNEHILLTIARTKMALESI